MYPKPSTLEDLFWNSNSTFKARNPISSVLNLEYVPYTLYPIPCTLYPIPYTLYPIPFYTLNLKH